MTFAECIPALLEGKTVGLDAMTYKIVDGFMSYRKGNRGPWEDCVLETNELTLDDWKVLTQ